MFSNARVHGERFFLSGMHAGGPDGTVVGGDDTYLQAQEAFRRVRALTEACGAAEDDIIVLRVYLTDIADPAESNPGATSCAGTRPATRHPASAARLAC
ncbi:RidA family protein, partial [Nocardia sp. NPDC004750]